MVEDAVSVDTAVLYTAVSEDTAVLYTALGVQKKVPGGKECRTCKECTLASLYQTLPQNNDNKLIKYLYSS